MPFRITGLDAERFRHLFGLPESDLLRQGARRHVADRRSKLPDRIELRDAQPGESLLLVNYFHQPADNPYRASHAIFPRESAAAVPFNGVDEIPPASASRVISLRGFDTDDMMVDAEPSDGAVLNEGIGRLFANPEIAYIQAHFARHGCYAARIDRL